ncbi:hypothetical protein RHMOL_Rhmol12G0011400 [Rhododendron molle]|uniref:Uncharacterized protein n=1 Tax=Rhododendron molle TaxID=49168 RepID=A0ACC0LE30_RHOML|nr:hypothetical protein RHMOL_Rhmol12G0011400 [Rhododendron molle]
MSHVRRGPSQLRRAGGSSAWEHDVNVVEDVDEVEAVKGHVDEGLAEESEVEEESQVERIIELDDGSQLGGSGAYTLNGGQQKG